MNEQEKTTIFKTMSLLNLTAIGAASEDLREQASKLYDELARIYATPE